MVFRFSFLVWSFCSLCLGADGEQNQFAGPETCTPCHRAISDSQSKTAMSNTWHGSAASSLPPDFHERKEEANGKVAYEVRRAGDLTEFSVVNAGRIKVTAPVRAMVGGKRHGLSFLLGMDQFGAFP